MKKIIGIITGVVALLASIITIICLKIAFPFKPSFYSYSSYFDEKTVEDINKKYSYKEYGDVNSFEFDLENNKIKLQKGIELTYGYAYRLIKARERVIYESKASKTKWKNMLWLWFW